MLVVNLSLVMKAVSNFIKQIKDFFHEVRTKGREGERVYTKCLLLYEVQIEDLIEMIKEQLSDVKLHMKIQVVVYNSTTITGQFIVFYK